jgi:hypothetical protein
LAAHLVEHVLFVRPPTTHPPVGTRWDALTDHVPDRQAMTKAHMVTAGLEQAVVQAGQLRRRLPESWWQKAYAHRRVYTDVHEPDYYEHMSLLDRLCFGDPEDPARMLQQFDERGEVDALGAALCARDHGLTAALQELGVEPRLAVDAGRPDLALSYHTLIEMAHLSATLRVVSNSTTRRLAAIACGTLMGGTARGIL